MQSNLQPLPTQRLQARKMSIPKTGKAWTIQGSDGFDSLKFNKEAAVPEVSDYEVLVKLHAASLNYRDLIIPKGKQRDFNCR